MLKLRYVGVGAENEVQIFYYFVESQRDPLHDPLLLYLTGGPGTTALYPLLFQIGPLSVNYDNSTWEKLALELNPNSWAKWLEEQPRFLNNPLYIGGTSYMGILVPVVTLEIYKGNERGDLPRLNIKCTSRINTGNILYPFCDDDNIDPTCLEAGKKYMEYFGNDKEVQKALHIREGTIEKFVMTNQTIHYDLNKEDSECYAYDIFSTIIYHQMLVSRNCQVLIISGDHDFTFPYVGAEQWITSLNLPVESPWNPWFVNNQVAGYRTKYAKNGYSLTHATIKGAGHSIALYKPEEAWAIVNGWLASHSYLSYRQTKSF
ncbi:hypothetical protein L1987_28135 [Smallanthus sonchifolius]|uniref:Uncharacterized protein n=1 Tax=Smallanthus sonchifolius TaxID=185202 RepID=A0ACB9IDQ1_9ASTR|nr:hypothetical protein L1987_28135 [Smallanthus sonchifolius]